MLKGMNFMPRLGFGKNQTRPPEYMEVKLQILNHRLGYQGGKDGPDSEEEWTLWERFMKEGNYSPYKGKPEPLFFEGKKVPRFKIFMDYLGEKGMDEPTLEIGRAHV